MQVEILRDVVSRAVIRWPESHSRIERGVLIALLGGVVHQGDDIWQVRSESAPERTYTVTGAGCDCQDASRSPQGACKHVWATRLLEIAAEREARLRHRDRVAASHDRAAADRVALAMGRAFAAAA